MPYSMSKFALSAAGAGLRAEMDQLKKNIHIALIEPGAIHTGFNQAMTDSKYAWMGPSSYFAHQAEKMQKQERATFQFLEAKSTDGIVKQIIKASEAQHFFIDIHLRKLIAFLGDLNSFKLGAI
jgi:short-subunit dehydrogenase